MARLTSDLVLSLTDKVSGPARTIGRNLDSLEAHQQRVGRGSRLTAEDAMGMSAVGPRMLAGTAAALMPIAGAFAAKEVISAAADFESALTNIQKKAGITAEQTAALGEEIKALATSGELAVPIEEIAAAYERGAAAGIPLADLREFAELSAKGADAFEMTAEEVGNFAATLKAGLGYSNQEVRNAMDQINSLADAGIADESALVDYFQRVGASLKTLGLNGGQSLALGSTMLNLGMTAEVAATATDALSREILTVSTLTGKKRKSFEKFMGPVGEFAALVGEDANGAIDGLLTRLGELDATDRISFLNEFVGKDHAPKILRLAEAVAEYRRNVELAADQDRWFGSLDKAYALKLDDLKSKWQSLKNGIETLAIDLGTMGMPAMKAGLDGALEVTRQLRDGLDQLAIQIDWDDVDAAKRAVGNLGAELRQTLNIDTSGSTIGSFFDEIARNVNQLSRVVKAVSNELADLSAFVRDPVGFMRRDVPKAQLQDQYGVKLLDQGQQDDANERQDKRENARHERERAARRREQERVSRSNPASPTHAMEMTQARAAAAGNREPVFARERPDAAERVQQLTGKPALTPAQTPAPISPPAERGSRVDLGQSTGAIPTPSIRPNIEAEIARQSEAAEVRAQQAGQRIAESFNVTAAPTVDARSIDAAIAKAMTLRRELNAIPAAARAASDAAASARADYSGLHADIEE